VPYLDRDGVAIYYEEHGTGESVPMLLSHGYSATAEMWTPNLEALSADRKVIAWDMRGHGRSDSPADQDLYSEALSVADMAAVLDVASAPQAVVGGLSLGGYLSLAFNLTYPERVAALVICDAGPGYRKDDPREEWNRQAHRRADALDQKGLAALGQSSEVTASQHRSAMGLALAARGILTQHDSRVIDSLSTISVPTLIVVGSEDKPFLAAADMMAAKIPGATKAVIDGAGHASNIDAPFDFNTAVAAFLGSL
jgi:pimeloyl-ACP methyl ester carboxylesterase